MQRLLEKPISSSRYFHNSVVHAHPLYKMAKDHILNHEYGFGSSPYIFLIPTSEMKIQKFINLESFFYSSEYS